MKQLYREIKLRMEISLSPTDFSIRYRDKIMLFGSCFAESIFSRMEEAGLAVNANPFGVLYNPLSVAQGLSDLINKKTYTRENLFLHQGLYSSFSHHSRFSGVNPLEVVQKINSELIRSADFLRQTRVLIITFGTASVYRLLSTGEVVANCHKLPSKLFEESRLKVNEVVEKWNSLIREIQKIKPDIKIIFTISPIRYCKNDVHLNSLYKSVLFLAVDELINANKSCRYFPAYEIMMDDLRDYRFYAEDLIHPNALAVSYIWDKFCDAYFDKDTIQLIREWESIQEALNHRPLHPETEEYKRFLEQAEKRKEEFLKVNRKNKESKGMDN
ncbi:MAG: GSCFA domain-containing protein [Candidatus Azobacteroides sp.]|nr:GSCFA domain-containing protein [Candidatus Azobacteroides sp.]